MSVLLQRYRLTRKGEVLDPDLSLTEALQYVLRGRDQDLDIEIGDYKLTLADGSGWPSGIANREHPNRSKG